MPCHTVAFTVSIVHISSDFKRNTGKGDLIRILQIGITSEASLVLLFTSIGNRNKQSFCATTLFLVDIDLVEQRTKCSNHAANRAIIEVSEH